MVLMVSSVEGKLRLPSVSNDTLLHNLKGNVGEREEREGTDNIQKSVDAYPNPSFSPANPDSLAMSIHPRALIQLGPGYHKNSPS